MEIDWMFLSFLVIAFFAVGGFFKGWWKEAVATLFLVFLLLLLMRPDWAQTFINVLNQIILIIWELAVRVLNSLLGFNPTGTPFQFDASSSGTWIIILILSLGLAALASRF
jgi:hypothetical protein